MALQKTYTETRSGFSGQLSCNNAYWKIVAVSGNKDEVKISVDVSNNGQTIGSKTYGFTPSVDGGSANFIKQGYVYLKTLPEFSGAEDV